jgi:hypothetical protein
MQKEGQRDDLTQGTRRKVLTAGNNIPQQQSKSAVTSPHTPVFVRQMFRWNLHVCLRSRSGGNGAGTTAEVCPKRRVPFLDLFTRGMSLAKQYGIPAEDGIQISKLDWCCFGPLRDGTTIWRWRYRSSGTITPSGTLRIIIPCRASHQTVTIGRKRILSIVTNARLPFSLKGDFGVHMSWQM